MAHFRLGRLFAALLAVLSLWTSTVELSLPELHDGDAEVTVVASPNSAPSQPHAPLPHHAMHVDHCGHSHCAPAVVVIAPAPRTRVRSAPVAHVATLASVDLPPHVRPPIG